MPKLKTPPEKVKLADGTEVEVIRTNGAGRIPYLDDSGAEHAGDLIEVLGKLKSGIDERTALETRARTAEEALAPFKALGPVEDLTKALDMTKKLTAGDLKTIEDVRRLQAEAVAERDQHWQAQVKAEQEKAAKLAADIEEAAALALCQEIVGKTIKDAKGKDIRVWHENLTGQGLHRFAKDHLRRKENGDWQVTKKPGDFSSSNILQHEFQDAPPLLALQELAKEHSYLLYKPAGGGSGVGNDGPGGGAGPSTMQRSEFLKLYGSNPDKALAFKNEGGKIVDDAAAA